MTAFRGRLGFCSNFYMATAEYDGVIYPTSEHAFQAAKTLDKAERKMVECADTPGDSKRLGKSVTLRSDWEDVKLNVMYEVLKSKFSNSRLKQMLLDTGDEELIEVNEWHDTFWGQCPVGNGENHLGKTLMRIRQELKTVNTDLQLNILFLAMTVYCSWDEFNTLRDAFLLDDRRFETIGLCTYCSGKGIAVRTVYPEFQN